MPNEELDAFLNEGATPEPAPQEPATSAPEAAAPETPAETPAEPAPEGQEPAAKSDGRLVPLPALEAERKQRQDWKEKALRYEGELAAIKAQMEEARKAPAPQAPSPPQERVAFRAAPNPIEDPQGYAAWFEEKQINERANISELVLRDEVADNAEVDGKIAIFKQAAVTNPRLMAALRVQPDPYRWAYEQGKQIEARKAEQAKREAVLKELGDDPAAYRAKIEAELRAQIEAEKGQAEPVAIRPAVQLPQSLANTRSANNSRTGPAFNGPTPLDELFPQR